MFGEKDEPIRKNLCEKGVISKELYDTAVTWMEELKYDDKLSDEYLIDEAHNIMFELHQQYNGLSSSYWNKQDEVDPDGITDMFEPTVVEEK